MTRYLFSVMGAPVLEPVTEDGRGPGVKLPRGSLALLTLLAMKAARTGLSREALSDLLWPDCAIEQARSRLSSALWRLRKTVGGPSCLPVIEERNGRIGLAHGHGVTVDVWDLQRIGDGLRGRSVEDWRPEEVAALETAIQARRGEFLAGIEGEWTLGARQVCAEAYEFGLECLIRFHRCRGHAEQAIVAARRLLRQDPYREDVHAILVELYAEQGQQSRAITQYATCRDLLKAELGVLPGAALQESLSLALAKGGTPAGDSDLRQMIRRIDDSMAELVRQVNELRSLLRRRGSAEPQDANATGDI